MFCWIVGGELEQGGMESRATQVSSQEVSMPRTVKGRMRRNGPERGDRRVRRGVWPRSPWARRFMKMFY
jgi:hypothetical protein